MFDFFRKKRNTTKKEEIVEDVLMKQSPDRRLLPHMPGKQRSGKSRRAISDDEVKKYPYLKFFNGEDANVRYEVRYPVKISVGKSITSYSGYASDISISGMRIHTSADAAEEIVTCGTVTLSFGIQPGTLPEGLEMKVKTEAHAAWPPAETVLQKLADVKAGKLPADTEFAFGMQFEHNLLEYSNKHHARYELMTASFLLFFVCLGVMLMRTESVIYFKFNKYLYLYSIIASTFLLTKYAFAFFYKPVSADENYTPGVTIIVPCFNEETWIRQTILNAMDQYYPQDKLEVIVVDDCSTDHSAQVIKETIQDIINQEGPEVAARISYILQPVNKGKREAMAVGAKHAQHELLVFEDSDSFLNPYAVINIVQPFKDEQVGGVSGRTDVANTYTNSLTKMQSVRYYIAFRVMKAAEGVFDTVSCLSGPLACYRKDLVLKYLDEWLNQKFLGQRATFGDDRAMTNLILRHNRTDYQDTSICYTIVPNDYDVFLKQQMRWKRSWLRESLIAGSFMWKKEPFAAISFYMGLLVPIIAPFIVCYNLIYIPITHRVFPTTFIVGMLLMALLMSACQALLRRSTTWLYGIWFCLYYELILLWQMPIAWFTFWKSTWGTRMTPADIAEQERKNKKDERETLPEVAGMAEEPKTDAASGIMPETGAETTPVVAGAAQTAVSPLITEPREVADVSEVEAISEVAGTVTEEPVKAAEAPVFIAAPEDNPMAAVEAKVVEADKETEPPVLSERTPIAEEPATVTVTPNAETSDETLEAARVENEKQREHIRRVATLQRLSRERAELIALIRENQRQVAAMQALMERELEMEEKHLALQQRQLSEDMGGEQNRNPVDGQDTQGEDKP